MPNESHAQAPSPAPRVHRAHWLALIVGIACVVFQVTDLVEPMRFSREDIGNGQWWRLLTGNLVHLGYPHLFLNLAGLAVISLLLASSMTVTQWSITGVVSMTAVGLGLWWFDVQLNWYVGLSGVLYGLLLGGAIAEFRRQKLIAVIIAVYTIGKIGWEQIYGAVDSSEAIAGGAVIVNAHLYGMVGGGVAAFCLIWLVGHHASRQ
ncbi:MAG: rhombosortase [Pseudomonadota bacterium]